MTNLHTTNRAGWALVVLAGLATSALQADAAAISYSVTDLGMLPGGTWLEPNDINSSGQIVGTWGATGGLVRSFLYSDGRLSDTTVSGASGAGINDAGQMTTGSDVAINNVGQVVGKDFQHNGRSYVSSNGERTDLPTGFQAMAINDHGQIAGRLFVDQSGVPSPYLFDNGQLVPVGPRYTSANAINNAGQIAGGNFMYEAHAFLYDGSESHDLDTLVGQSSKLGGWSSTANAINNQGQIVGYSDTGEAAGDINGVHAFLYQHGTMLDLNALIPPDSGWVLRLAVAINDSGMIIGDGYYNGEARAFVLKPTTVPEPSTLVILGVMTTALGIRLITNRLRGIRMPQSSLWAL